MVLIFSLLVSFLSLFCFNYFLFPLVLFFSFLVFIFSSNFSFNQAMLCNYGVLNDVLSFFMVFMLIVVLFCSYLNVNMGFKVPLSLFLSFMSLFLFCYLVFSTSSAFFLYMAYEASLIPILYIIVKYGVYPERSMSAMMLLIYTAILSFPFLLVLFFIWCESWSFNFFLLQTTHPPLSLVFSLLTFFAFAVKLPMYGFHFWLPMAHVEAPTYGSMILAGVLLKLGGVGLYRFSGIMSMTDLKFSMLGYFMIMLIVVTFICMFQSDFKRLIAYSSVSHMMAIPILMLSSNLLSDKALLSLMLLHGLSSPILFSLVGLIYSFYGTRQLVIVRGLALISPLLSLTLVLAFFFTLSAPPFPSFLSEVYFMISSYFLSSYLAFIFVLFAFLSLIYNLSWLVSIMFTKASNLNMNFTPSYKIYFSLVLGFLVAMLVLLLLTFM